MQLQARAVCDENQGWELGTCTVSPAWGSAPSPQPPHSKETENGRHQTPTGIRKVSSVQSLSHPHSPLARGPGSSNFCLYTHIPSYLHTPIPSSTCRPPPHTHKGTRRTKRSLYGLLPGALRALSLAAPWIWCFFPTSSQLGQGRAPGGVWPLGSV